MKDRARVWALTININADCYKKLDDCLGTIIGVSDKYAYIKHDKDININEETGEESPKAEHIHLLLSFKNARAYNSIQKTFIGAHIEKALGESAYANYLLHNGKPQKYHYNADEVITNDKAWYNALLSTRAKETFVEDKILYYVLVEQCNSYIKLCKRFGASQLPYSISQKLYIIKGEFLQLKEEEQNRLLADLQDEWDEDLPF